MAINVCPGPIRPIRQISAYFPRLSPTSSFSEPLSPNQVAAPTALSPGAGQSGGVTGAGGGGGSPGLLSPLLPGVAGGGGSLSAMSSVDTSIEIDSCDSDDNSESPGNNGLLWLMDNRWNGCLKRGLKTPRRGHTLLETSHLVIVHTSVTPAQLRDTRCRLKLVRRNDLLHNKHVFNTLYI